MDVKEKIKELPDTCGVYILKGTGNKILYVGKATSLRQRVSSHFQNPACPQHFDLSRGMQSIPGIKSPKSQHDFRGLSKSAGGYSPRLGRMAALVEDVDYLLTKTPAEALILESNLIKKHQPKFNSAMKDDKSYPFIKITIDEDFPRVLVGRGKGEPGVRYFGPYTNAEAAREAVNYLRRVFPFRTCVVLPKVPCLYYHLSLCPAPCSGRVAKEDYRRLIREISLFLEGKRESLLAELTGEMNRASREERYEEAAKLRDRIQALSGVIAGIPYSRTTEELQDLANVLDLPTLPLRIEGFDVSNIQGKEPVGSLVLFEQGRPRKDGYRRFKIRETAGVDDYRMLAEVIRRRYSRALEEKELLPDLIVVDGGKGQVSSASDEIERLGLDNIPLLGLAKEFEHIFISGKKKPVVLPRSSRGLQLLQRVRDEAHRFAHAYHRLLHGKAAFTSMLDNIPGIGEKRKKNLLQVFGSISEIRNAELKEILNVPGMNRKTARAVLGHLQSQS